MRSSTATGSDDRLKELEFIPLPGPSFPFLASACIATLFLFFPPFRHKTFSSENCSRPQQDILRCHYVTHPGW